VLRGSSNGKVAVYLDGRRVGILNLRSGSTTVRVAWTRTFAVSGKHTIRLVNLGSGSRGHLGLDGVVTLL